jgi:ribosomal protein L2
LNNLARRHAQKAESDESHRKWTLQRLFEATPDEVNRLAGKTLYQWNSYHDRWELEARVGTEFNVREGIEQLHHNAERTAEVARLKQQLQSIILQLELIEPFMKAGLHE